MAAYISEREVASVRLLTLEISEDELGVYKACLDYILSHYDNEVIENIFGALREEIEGMLDDLTEVTENAKTEVLV